MPHFQKINQRCIMQAVAPSSQVVPSDISSDNNKSCCVSQVAVAIITSLAAFLLLPFKMAVGITVLAAGALAYLQYVSPIEQKVSSQSLLKPPASIEISNLNTVTCKFNTREEALGYFDKVESSLSEMDMITNTVTFKGDVAATLSKLSTLVQNNAGPITINVEPGNCCITCTSPTKEATKFFLPCNNCN